jgi:hypothetical protein
MAGDKKPPPKGAPKPFLGDEELSNELDAWDSMFDGLHGGPEAAQTPADEPVMAWPAPEPAPVIEAKESAPRDSTVNEDLDAQMTLDNAIEADATADATSIDMQAAPPARAPFKQHADPLETDFSEIGASTAPSALGDFLGAAPGRERPGTAPGYDEDEDNDPHTSVSKRGGTPLPIDVDVDDDDVLTSASRPNAMMPEAPKRFSGRGSTSTSRH